MLNIRIKHSQTEMHLVFHSRLWILFSCLFATFLINSSNFFCLLHICICEPCIFPFYSFHGIKQKTQNIRSANRIGEDGVQSTLFCIFNHCYFISTPNKLKIWHPIKQLLIHNIMAKHENNALQKKKLYSQLKKVLFLSNVPHAWGTLDMSMGYT